MAEKRPKIEHRRGYAFPFEKDKTYYLARGKELHISPKKSRELCRALQGMRLSEANDYLHEVEALRQPVPMKRFSNVAHKRGMAGARFPVGAAKQFLRILQNAEENASFVKAGGKVDPDDLRIVSIAVSKGAPIKGMMQRAMGNSGPWNEETVNLQVILQEVEG